MFCHVYHLMILYAHYNWFPFLYWSFFTYIIITRNGYPHHTLCRVGFLIGCQSTFFLEKSQLIKNLNLLMNLIIDSWSANRCLATVSCFMNLRTKIISKYKNECPATLKVSWFNKNTNHQDTSPYHTLVCRATSGLMVSDNKRF